MRSRPAKRKIRAKSRSHVTRAQARRVVRKTNDWQFYSKGADSNMRIRQKLCREKGYETKIVAGSQPGYSVLYVKKCK